jgi:hypothetical protein
MAKKKAKVKAKAKAKTKTKAKPKSKASVKTKPKVQAKAKTKPKAKPKPKAKAKHNGPPPPVVKPGMCDPITAATGTGVVWQNVPTTGCTVSAPNPAPPNYVWPFNPPSPIFVPYLNPGQTPNAVIVVGSGQYIIEVGCCQNQMPKTVTVP